MKIKISTGIALAICLAGSICTGQAQTTNTTDQILKMHTFREGLVLAGNQEPTAAENKELLEVLNHLDEEWWTAGVEQFFKDHPNSPWAASLHYDYASYCRRTGRTTKALEQYEAAWANVKGDSGLIAYTNRDNQVTRYGRDVAGRLTAITNANNEVVQSFYNPASEITSLVDGLNHTNSWQYNQFGWLTNKVDGLARNAFRYSYNANGWITNRFTPEKGNTGYTFDNVGNVKSIIYPLFTINYGYDPLNRLTNMVDTIGTTTFGYTAAGLLASENGPWTNDTVSYTYSQQLQTALSLSQPSGSWSQSYGYDSTWHMTNVVSPAGSFGYSYNFQPASSLISGISLPNGANIANSYDTLARLTQTTFNNYWGHTLDGYSHQYDPIGLQTNIVRNLGLTSSSVNVGYDNIGQLTSWLAKETNGTARLNEQFGFGYDAAHNVHSRTNGALTQTFSADAANQLNSVTRSGTFTLSGAIPAPATNLTVNGQPAQIYSDFTFARTNLTLANGNNTFTNIAQNVYGVAATNTFTVNLPSSVSLNSDSNGSLTNDGTRTFGYDSENQLTNVMVAGQWQSSFVYDGLNRRRIARDFSWNGSAWILTNEVHYIYDGNLVIQERDTNNNPLVTYTRGLDFSGNLRDAGGIGGLLARTDANGSTFYHSDGAGNITALMNAQQNIVGRYLYSPFGKILGQWGTMADANTMRFSSKQVHNGNYDFGFRWYLPDVNRWSSKDPLGERGGYNLYRFAYNTPGNLTDKDGRILPLLIAAFVVGAVLAEEPANAPGPNDPTEPMLSFPQHLEAGAGSALLAGATAGLVKGSGSVADSLAGKAPVQPKLTVCPNNTPFVIGRNMKDRVIPFANQYGFDYYKPGPSLGSEAADLEANRAAIQNVIDSGRPIIDIGLDPANPNPSIYYNMESQLVSENSVPVIGFYGFQPK